MSGKQDDVPGEKIVRLQLAGPDQGLLDEAMDDLLRFHVITNIQGPTQDANGQWTITGDFTVHTDPTFLPPPADRLDP